ncbi:extensin-2 [Nilaparvata lugens]|uniref:extensin-2 n=1 Tax=Nilaparvata lugens TaxID=108931 RepID=UPI00193EA649|nr:extensin-2 [Nilaparvata lugens]XP_039295226.1 extensin-2 [Nilaparvata lugens]
MPDIQIKLTLFCIVLLSANTVCEYVLEDLIAMEDNQRAIHNIGDDSRDGVEHRQLIRTVRQKKTDNEVGEKQTSDKDKPKENNDDDEEKKTLAQQVADGKYGLIQTEIFSDKPERPGIISYEVNPEVPKDNVNNLGGLKAEEIWLAENHLLVLGGGGFGAEGRGKPVWPPIDNYVAPERQVKIPPNPKVPPPFPVQLRPGGPIEFLRGENGTGGPPPFPPFPGFFPPGNFSGIPPPFFPPPGNFSLGNGGAPGPYGGQLPPFPFPPQLPPGGSFNGSFIPPPPQFLPPPGGPGGFPPNQSLPFDEDDPSIYYPPPYDFVYPRDNSSHVPAGPLVPGIVLPPPPDFFAPLNEKPARQRRPPPAKPTPTKPPRPTKKPPEKYNYATPARGSTASKPTKRPSVQIITEEPQQHINEVTPFPHSLPPNAVVQGWLPIPAPRPFYITRPRGSKQPYNKELENTTPAVAIKERRPTSSQIYSDDGYYYEKPKSRPHTLPKENPSYNPTKLVNVDPAYNYNPNPIYITSTIPPPPQVPYQNTPQPQNGKALKTFYFYEEPHDISTTTVRPPVQANYYSTPVPQSGYYLPAQEQPRYVQNKYELPPLRASTRAPPVNYFYITEAPPRAAVTTSSRKPPIYEYSYTAPGYGTIDAPKVGTPTPLGISHASINNQIPDDGSYNYYDDYLDQTTPRTPVVSKHRYNQDNLNLVKNNLIYTTERPIYRAPSTKAPPRGYVYTTTQRPILSTTAAPYSADHQTQNPYYAFFTHHDAGLIDDITKKYFTIFGQKLNNPSTTPLTPTENSYETATRKPVVYNRVVTSTPPPQRLQEYYYSSQPPPAYYDYDYYDSVEQINRNNQGNIYSSKKSQYYDRSSPQSQSARPPSLEHDIDVNYKTQNLQIEADAEMIDPQKDVRIDPLRQRAEQLQLRPSPIGSSLISYSLPGNGGGHFYFLTPQSIQDEADANAYAAYSQQQQLGPLYYNKRNTQRQQRQQPVSSSSGNSQSSSSTRNSRRQNKQRQYNRQSAEAT